MICFRMPQEISEFFVEYNKLRGRNLRPSIFVGRVKQ